MKKTAIIILNYNNPSDTIACIKSVECHNTAPVKYVVVDNGSTDGISVPEIDRFLSETFAEDYMRIQDTDAVSGVLPYITFLVSSSNDGYARGNNKGIALTANDNEIDRVLILNNDILFIEDIVPALIEAQTSLLHCGIVSPLLLTGKGDGIDWNCARRDTPVGVMIRNNFLAPFHWLLKKHYDDLYRDFFILHDYDKNYPDFIPVELPSGSCMLIKKDVFFEIGCFDPATFLYYEENILYRKLLKLGLQNYIVTSLRCIHLGAATTVNAPSTVVARATAFSRCHYVRNYLETSWAERMLLGLSDAWINIFIGLKGIVKRIK